MICAQDVNGKKAATACGEYELCELGLSGF
jgi:hypothetical protein